MSKDMVKKQENSLANISQKRGMEAGVDQEDLTMPRAVLMQSKSPQVEADPKKYLPGMILNNITNEEIAGDFIPIIRSISYVKFNPRKKDDPNFDPAFEPGALIWRTTDPTDPRTEECKFGSNGEKPTAMKCIDFLCYFPKAAMPIVVSFSKTSFKTGKKLTTLAALTPGDLFSRRYTLGSKKEANEIGSYYVFTVEPNGVPEKGDLEICEGLYNQFRQKEIRVHEEGDIDIEL